MSDITALARIIAGSARNVDISSNTPVVLTIKIGGSVSNTELTKAILDKLLLINAAADSDGTFDTRYTKKTDLAALTAGKGASLVGIQDAGSYFSTKNVEAALQQLAGVVGTGTAAGISYNHATSGLAATNVQTAIDEVVTRIVATETVANAAIPATQKGSANGVATLDSGGKVPVAQLPNSVMEYKGTYNASTNTPTLVDGTGNTGDVYRVTVAGAGVDSLNFVVGDYAIYNGSTWEKAHSGSDAVVTVNGFAGIVVLTTDNVNEGTTNLYFTTSRAQTAAVVNAINSGVTATAPSQAAVFTALAGKQAASANLTAADTFFGGTSFTFTQANQLIQAGNADSLHFHSVLKKTGVVGESFAANTTFAVRMSSNAAAETLRQFRKGDITTTTTDLFYVIGLLQSASALTTGNAATIVTNGTLILGSSDTPFSSADVGKPVFLTASGTFSSTPPSTAGQGVTRIGIIEDTDRIFVQPSVVGVL
jgi:hypothetical protein